MSFDLTTPFGAIELASLSDQPIAEANKMLLVVGARVANTGMKWVDDKRQSLGDQWGTAPARIEPVIGKLTLRGLKRAQAVRLQPLDVRGQPWGDARAFAIEGDAWTIDLTGEPGTPWYVIEVVQG